MASSPTVDYPEVKRYLCTFGHSPLSMLLVLCYNVNRRFQFVNLTQGRIMNLEFDSVEEAEAHLEMIAETLVKNIQIDFQ